jgi:hypothetical protein
MHFAGAIATAPAFLQESDKETNVTLDPCPKYIVLHAHPDLIEGEFGVPHAGDNRNNLFRRGSVRNQLNRRHSLECRSKSLNTRTIEMQSCKVSI